MNKTDHVAGHHVRVTFRESLRVNSTRSRKRLVSPKQMVFRLVFVKTLLPILASTTRFQKFVLDILGQFCIQRGRKVSGQVVELSIKHNRTDTSVIQATTESYVQAGTR